MENQLSKLILVDSVVLPEVIMRVLEVKKLLADHTEKNSAAACKKVGISRSAYYKYKDHIFSYNERVNKRIINLHAVLKDEPGVLSSVLASLHAVNANILTVNQSIPVDGVATITISLHLNPSSDDSDADEIYRIKSTISGLYGIVEIKILSGE